MNRLKLVLPTIEYKEKLMDYKREFINSGDSMDGTAGLRNAKLLKNGIVHSKITRKKKL
ncbi:hypothetical protein [Alkaliphilus pronyensis]|uniref:hypothetical protein n=1 Tax=Alkaliphilus pronyensis TaxID=1482732 RepID=UPI002ED2386D